MKLHQLCIVISLVLANAPAIGQVYSNDELYRKGYNEVKNQNWVPAATYFFALIQRKPIDFINDKTYEKEVNDGYNASKKNTESQIKALNDYIKDLNSEIASLRSQLKSGLSSTQYKLSVEPQIPVLRKPIPERMILVRPATESIEGQWQATLKSSDGTVFTGIITIATTEDEVNGVFKLSDNSGSKVTGIYDGINLMLMRNTGAATIQVYTLKKVETRHFSGAYKNEGNVADSGTIELTRFKSKSAPYKN